MSRESDGSRAGLTEAEFDQLADYLADALEPDEALGIGRLVADDPRWSAAHLALIEADVAVRTALSGSVASTGPMPADIASRLDNVLRDLARTDGTASAHRTASAQGRASARGANGGVPSVAGAGTVVTTVTSLAAARSRRKRLVTTLTVAAAAAVAVLGGVGVAANLARSDGFTTSTALDDAGAPERAEAPLAGAPPTYPMILVSGTDYTEDTLGSVTAAPEAAVDAAGGDSSKVAAPQGATKSDVGKVPAEMRAAAPPALTRLLDPAALAACLQAIRASYPGSVASVDFARFSGEPALVVLVRQSSTSTVVAVGPDCGRFGADQKGSAPAR